MKTFTRRFVASLFIAVLSGCKTQKSMMDTGLNLLSDPGTGLAADGQAESDMTEVQDARMLVWSADLRLQVSSVSDAVGRTTLLVERHAGFVEQKTEYGDQQATLTLRIPSKSFKETVGGLEALGTLISRKVEAADVTAEYIDVEARLKNKRVLRDQLKQLLEKAVEVKDVLTIETELNRLQGDLESMETRIKYLKGLVDYSVVKLVLEKEPPPVKPRILGPLGYLFHGVYWCVEKLFVIRE